MNLNQLTYLGLSEGEITVYQALLENGPQPASEIIKLTNLKKGDTYNKLYDLVKRGLIEEFTQNKQKHFMLSDPHKLEELAENQYKTALQAKNEVQSTLPLVMSTYNLSYNKPGVAVFEGIDDVNKMLDDALDDPKLEILQFLNIEEFDERYPTETAQITEKRLRLGIKKRIILPQTEENVRTYKSLAPDYFTLTKVRFIPKGKFKFLTNMQIYGNTVSYVSIKKETVLGVLIEDVHIAETQRGLFEIIWEIAPQLPELENVLIQ